MIAGIFKDGEGIHGRLKALEKHKLNYKKGGASWH
jgi:hypothetical protein